MGANLVELYTFLETYGGREKLPIYKKV